MATETLEIKNMRLISHHDLDGFGNIGEGVALHQAPDGRRIFYMAHVAGPKDFTSVDVTDINNPKLVAQTELAYDHLRSNSLAIVGNIMLIAYQSNQHGEPGTGVGVYDVSNPDDVKKISHYDTAGPQSKGCHCLWWVDGEYAHLATGTTDANLTNPKDDQFYVILDVRDPANPKEAGRWWFPGTQVGDSAEPPPRHPQFDSGFSVHNTNVYLERPDRVYCGWKDGGVVVLDIADKANPQLIANVSFSPPFPGFVHTVLPLFERDLLVVSQEANLLHGGDHPKLVWMMDNSLETKPCVISTLPLADTDDFFARPGRYGAHNIYENTPGSTSYFTDQRVYATFFNGGIRVFDIKNPWRPDEIAYFVPPVPEGADANGLNDIHVDENGILYVTDRLKGGLYILELTV